MRPSRRDRETLCPSDYFRSLKTARFEGKNCLANRDAATQGQVPPWLKDEPEGVEIGVAATLKIALDLIPVRPYRLLDRGVREVGDEDFFVGGRLSSRG